MRISNFELENQVGSAFTSTFDVRSWTFDVRISSFSPRRGYTLVELFLTLAVLMIVLGMMIKLSDKVRRQSADRVTQAMFSRLTALMAEYQKRNGQLPPIPPVIHDGVRPTEESIDADALANNAQMVKYLNLGALAASERNGDDPLLRGLRISRSQPIMLEDPWGRPIVFMARQDPAVGLARLDAFFFVSAGPDRRFLTKDDNLYSYEDTVDILNTNP